MDPTFLALLKCPACGHVGMTSSARRVVCAACDREFDRESGWVNLLDVDQRGEAQAFSAEQRLMESELVARVYERFWRPTFVRLVAGSGARAATGGFAGELFIHKNSLAMDERRGPWLDSSCGPGTFTRAMAASAPGDLVIGLDLSRAMLDAAVAKLKGYANVVLVRADAHELPFADGSLGGVNCSGALHAYDDPPQAFRDILRVLRPGGLWVASTFAPAKSMVGRVAARVAGIRRFAPHELRSQLSRIGFADYEEIRLGDSFIFRARKP